MNKQQETLPNLVLYGNLDGEELIAIDADSMKVHAIIPLQKTERPYAVDRIGDKLLSIARDFKAVERIDVAGGSGTYQFTNKCTQPLKHAPRTAKGNASGSRALVSGADVAVSSVVEFTNECVCVKTEVGEETSRRGEGAASGIDFGGSNASGHEFWLDERRFAVLDRVRRVVSFFDSDSPNPALPTDSVALTTTPHHLAKDPSRPGRFYVSCEGSPRRSIPPSVFVIEEARFGFEPRGQVFLPVPYDQLSASGGHHLDLFGGYIFMGSAEGNVYVIDTSTMRVVSSIQTGLGHGHTGFFEVSEAEAFGVSINHRDTFVSVIDARAHRFLGNVEVAKAAPTREAGGRLKLAQSHTSFRVIRDGVPYFYLMVPHESRFVEVNVAKRVVERELDVAADPTIKHAKISNLYMVQGTVIEASDNRGTEVVEICTNCD